MDIKLRAKKFAIKAHNGQRRKTDKAKPMIIHPINVADILKEYQMDDNVIAAGYLHDVVEDTKYNFEDITEKFGDDIASLVYGASEPDKSLSWEARKQHTIDTIKELDYRHKAVVCADKISNLEDLRIFFEMNGSYDFSAFKRDIDSQKWYYTEVYNSLIYHEDANNPMYVRLKALIDYIFYDKKDGYLNETIFKDQHDELMKLNNLHYRKQELYKLKALLNIVPYVIEFSGTPRTGKTTLINNLYDFFKKGGFSVTLLEEFTTSREYKEKIYPHLKDNPKNVINTEIPKYVLKQLEQAINKNTDIIIIDRGIFDRVIWVDRLYTQNGMDKEEYEAYKELYLPLIKNKINIIIATYADSLTAIKRDYNAHLSLENRSFLNEKNVNEYNQALLKMQNIAKKNDINLYLFDTTNTSQRELSIEIADTILSNMREEYLKRVNDNKELIRKRR